MMLGFMRFVVSVSWARFASMLSASPVDSCGPEPEDSRK
jgi:hypothetical protein